MSLYYDAASIILDSSKSDSSLKAKVYGSKKIKRSPAQVYALISETSKWNEVLNEVVERSQLLSHERKLTPALSLLLVHDLLLAKTGVAAPANHALRVAVEKHKARLQAEFTKARLRRGCATVNALLQHLQKSAKTPDIEGSDADATDSSQEFGHPRWVRINTLKSTLDDQLKSTFADFRKVETLREILDNERRSPPDKLVHVDLHVPDLVAIPSKIDLVSSAAYPRGEIIFQDKASCFPAYLLDPQVEDGELLDACAAPGNKTTHLVALARASRWGPDDIGGVVHACERDGSRSRTLMSMLNIAGAAEGTSIRGGQDFLKLNPQRLPWNEVGGLLLDPSCSGSGIVGREASAAFVLPSNEDSKPQAKSRKRKHEKVKVSIPPTPPGTDSIEKVEEIPDGAVNSKTLQDRLKSLSAFQTKLVLHAMSFPAARKIVYSTCSVHNEENEGVVLAALNSPIAREQGWRMMRREEQVSGMKAWHSRGRPEACESSADADIVAEACIRCSKFTEDGTQGFFVAAFVRRDSAGGADPAMEDDWAGFSDQDG
ncbi:MAG: hypothetical protein MMC23_004114 [Stictis urceolatum]|nr:hypothetical protein [Stictis urceolata]